MSSVFAQRYALRLNAKAANDTLYLSYIVSFQTPIAIPSDTFGVADLVVNYNNLVLQPSKALFKLKGRWDANANPLLYKSLNFSFDSSQQWIRIGIERVFATTSLAGIPITVNNDTIGKLAIPIRGCKGNSYGISWRTSSPLGTIISWGNSDPATLINIRNKFRFENPVLPALNCCDSSFSGLQKNYCTASFSSILVPAVAGGTFAGPGVFFNGTVWYFKPSTAGPGIHTITYTTSNASACAGKKSSQIVVVDPAPCVTTVSKDSIETSIPQPQGIFTDCYGQIYATSSQKNAIFKIDTFGIASIVAGDTLSAAGFLDGPAAGVGAARFNRPAGIVAFNDGTVFIADNGNNRIRRIQGGNVTTLVSGLSNPYGLTLSADRTKLYVSEQTGGNLIKEVVIATGVATAIAGSSAGFLDGTGTSSRFNNPSHMSVNGNFLYVADQGNNRIRRIDLTTLLVTTIAGINSAGTVDGSVNTASLFLPNSASSDCNGIVYTSDINTHTIRKLTPTPIPGDLSLYSGAYFQPGNIDGTSTSARYNKPSATSVYVRGFLDIADQGNNRIRRIAIEDWESGAFNGLDSAYCQNDPNSTLQPLTCAGSYTCSDPSMLGTVTIGSTVFTTFRPLKVGTFKVSYTYNSGSCPATITKTVRVKAVTKPLLGADKQICGNNVILQAQNGPFVAYEWSTDLKTFSPSVTAPNDFLSINSITAPSDTFVLRATNAFGCKATDTIFVRLGAIPDFIISSTQGDTLCNGGSTLLKAELSLANLADSSNYRFKWNTNLAKDTTTRLLVNASYNYHFTVSARIGAGCQLTKNKVVVVKSLPQICISVVKEDISGNLIKDYGYDSVIVSTVAGLAGTSGTANGVGAAARFNRPSDLFLFKDTLYIADRANNKIRRMNLNTNAVTDFMGTGANTLVDSSLFNVANFSEPDGITFDNFGNMYVSNLSGQVITKYNRLDKRVYLVAGSPNSTGTNEGIGANSRFDQPRQLASDAFGNIFVCDYNNHAIRKLTPFSRSRYNTFNYAGKVGQTPGYLDGKGTNSLLNWPWGIAVSPEGKLIFADEANHVMRSIGLDSIVSTIAGLGTTPGSIPILPKITIAGIAARFRNPWNIAIDKSGVTYICDAANSLIKKLDQKNNVGLLAGISGVVGSGNGGIKEATFNTSTGIAIDPKNNDMYVADRETHIIRKIKRNKTIFICTSDTAKENLNPVRIKTDCGWQGGNFKREWTLNGVPLASGDEDFPIRRPGTYVLKLTETVNTGLPSVTCSSSIFDTVYVRFYPNQTIAFTKVPNIILCPDTFRVAATPGFVSYNWNIKQGSSLFDTSTTDPSQVLNFNLVSNGTFTYEVSGINTNGCSFKDVRSGSLNRVISSITPNSGLICEGDSVILNGDAIVIGGPDSPVWRSKSGFKLIDPFNVVFKPSQTDTIYFSVASKAFVSTTNTRTCKDTAMAIITVNRAPDAFAGNDTTLCGGIGEAYLTGRLTGINGRLPFTFTWQNLSNLADSVKTKFLTVTPPTSTSYQFYVKDSLGCVGRDTVRVNLSPKVDASVAFNDSIICPNSSLQLLSAGSAGTPYKNGQPYRFLWLPNVAITPSNLISNPLVSPFDSISKYVVQVSDTLGCKDTASVTVRLTNLKISFKQKDTTVCAGISVPLRTTLSGGKPNYDFTWSPSSSQLISNNKILQPIATPKDTISTTRYLLSIEDAGGCFVYDTIDITVNENPKVFSSPKKAGADTSVCTGNPAYFKAFSLNGTEPYVYTWTEPIGQVGNLSTSVNDTASGNPSSAINTGTIYKYFVTTTDLNGCTSIKDSVEVLAFPTPVVSLPPIDTGCFGTDRVYNVSNPANNGLSLSYNWIGGGVAGAFDYIRVISAPGTYQVSVVDNNTGCGNRASLDLAFLQPLSGLTLDAPIDLCKNEPLDMVASVVGSSPVVFNWSTPNGVGAFVNPTLDTVVALLDSMRYIPSLLLDPATLDITVTASNKCNTITAVAPLSQTKTVIYKDVPTASIVGANPPEIFILTPITFTQSSFGFDDLQWNFGDGTPQSIVNSTAPSVVYTFLANGNFITTLTATKINGCKDIDTLRLDVIKNQILYIPNVFSPASNEVKNNSLRVMGMNITSQNFDFEVYNRWGEIVYQTNDFSEANSVGWNGKFKNTGQPQAMGVYTYLVKGKFFDGTPFDKVGNVTLIR